MKHLLCAFAFVLSCMHKPTVPPPVPAGTPLPPVGVCKNANTSDVLGPCGKRYYVTPSGKLSCVLCLEGRECTVDFQYCVGAAACDDPRCTVLP